MILLIAGSRNIEDKAAIYKILNYYDSLYGITKIIHGKARGADLLAREWAIDNNIKEEGFPPNYEAYGGKRAPIMRNIKMVKMCDKGGVIWNGKSPGSKFTLNELKKTKKLLFEEVILN